MRSNSQFVFVLIGLSLTVPSTMDAQHEVARKTAPRTRQAIIPARIPISFEPNVGQFKRDASYIVRGPGYGLLLTSSAAIFGFGRWMQPDMLTCNADASLPTSTSVKPKNASRCADGSRKSLRLRLLGANPAAKPEGRKPVASYSNYLIGDDPHNWRTHVPQFAEVWYPNVYPGVDLVYHGEHGELEYDFIVAPHANAKVISLAFDNSDGHQTLNLNATGDLVIPVAQTEVLFRKPRLYQGNSCLHAHSAVHSASGISCKAVAGGRFVLRKHDSWTKVTFELPAYDHAQALIVDPIVSFSTFLGGGADDSANGIAVDSTGNIYLVGTTDSTNFPVTANPLQKNLAGNGESSDAFVTKLSADGSSLIFSTYLGGSSAEFAHGIAVDSSNNVYVTGETYSVDFPVVTPYQTMKPGSGFVSKLSPDGASLIFSTYLGGSLEGSANGIAIDSGGEAVVAGRTYSVDFPVVNAFQPSHASDNGEGDAFVTKFSADGQSLVFSTYLGGNSNDMAQGVALDSSGNIYVAGITYSSDFPVTPEAYETTFDASDNENSFVTKFSPSGALIYSTYLQASQTFGIAANASGNVFVTGSAAKGFPVVAGAFQTTELGLNAFVTEFDVTGSSLVYSTFLGGSNTDTGNAIAVDSSGNAYVTGETNSLNFPLQQPLQSTLVAGVSDAFVSELNSTGSQLLFSTYLGGGAAAGSGSQQGNAIAVDNAGNIYVAGETNESDFPVVHAFQPTLNGFANAFVTKYGLDFSVSGTPSTQTVSAGQSAIVSLSLEPESGFTQEITFSCSGNPQGSSCVFSPASVTLDGLHSASVTATVSTTANAADLPAWGLSNLSRFALGLLGISLSILLTMSRRRTRLAFIALIMLGLFLTSCGGGSGGGTNTPNGTYTIVMTATSGNLTHSFNFTLTVD